MRILIAIALCLTIPVLVAAKDGVPAGEEQTLTCDLCVDVDDAITPTLAWQTVAGSIIGQTNNEYTYSFCAVQGGTYTFSTCEASSPGSATYDSALSIWEDGGGTCGTQMECNDDNCSGEFLHSEITWVAPASGDYLIVVDAFSGNTGDYVLAYMGDPCSVPVEPSSWGFLKSNYR